MALSQAYRQNQEQIAELSRRVLDHLQKVGGVSGEGPEPDQQAVFQAAQFLLQDYDPVNGGLGGAPKFPRSLELGFLLYYYRFSGEAQVLEKLAFTLEKMARGVFTTKWGAASTATPWTGPGWCPTLKRCSTITLS